MTNSHHSGILKGTRISGKPPNHPLILTNKSPSLKAGEPKIFIFLIEIITL